MASHTLHSKKETETKLRRYGSPACTQLVYNFLVYLSDNQH